MNTQDSQKKLQRTCNTCCSLAHNEEWAKETRLSGENTLGCSFFQPQNFLPILKNLKFGGFFNTNGYFIFKGK